MRLARLAALLAALPSLAAAQAIPPMAGEGGRIAQQWCANCHAVAPGMTPPTGDAVASFPAIAALRSTTEMSLRVFLQTPHANMPNFQLSRAETDALVAYILSLRR
ncbi:MAG: cytochrome c [Rubritepida sp.]|jgi:mono/diheme cytochrome c family protein|nr:cytochrome c [Rubritepida sp.]